MYLRATLLTSLFGLLAVGSYYAAMAPLSDTSVDEGFYQDLSLLSRFDDQKIGYRSGIDSDQLNVRSYFFNNSFNLTWRKKPSQGNNEQITGNAFLLNLMIPDWMTEYHQDRHNYSPKSYVGGDEVTLLLGTSFSFVKQLFTEVTDWSKDVNCQNGNGTTQKGKQPSCESKTLSSKENTHELLFSHPWPIETEKNPKLHQKYLYTLGDPTYTSFDNDVRKPYNFSISPKNVEAIYAAVDLQINQRLLDIDLGFRRKAQYDIANIHRLHPSSVEWKDKIKDVYGNERKIAVDFAVLKVKFHVANLKRQFLDYLIDLYKKTTIIPPILSSEFEVKNERTDAIYLGGWEPMTEREIDYHTMDNLFLQAKPKSSNGQSQQESFLSKNASTCKDDCVDLKLYETYFSRSTDKAQDSSNYEIVDKKWYPNDQDGVLFLKYRIKNKNKNWTLPHQKELLIPGFKATDGASKGEILKNWTDEQFLKDRKLVEFLEAKPKAHARWREYGIKYSYFSFQSLQSAIFSGTVLGGNEESNFNLHSPLGVFKLNNKNYINIAHHLEVPNMGMKNGKGMLAIMKHPEKQEKTMLGMYGGVSLWTNPVSGKEREVGQIMMFISPWRYDLFNSTNNLSKPSLGDVLIKRGLQDRLIQINRFRIKDINPKLRTLTN